MVADKPDGIQTRVLVADDDEAIRALLEVMLENCTVVTTADGQEALAVLQDATFDAAILDVMMPVVDGFSVVDVMRRSSRHQDTAVVMLTARASEADHLRAFSAGADAYVTKPFNPDHVLTLLHMLRAQTSRERAEQRTRDLRRAQLFDHIERLFV